MFLQERTRNCQLCCTKTRYNYCNSASYIWKLQVDMNRIKRMKGICHLRSRGRLISPSLPVVDDRYLNLSLQKRPTGRNLGRNRSVRRSGTTSGGTALLVTFERMRSFLALKFLPSQRKYRFNEILAAVDGIYLCQFTSLCGSMGSLKVAIGNNTACSLLFQKLFCCYYRQQQRRPLEIK